LNTQSSTYQNPGYPALKGKNPAKYKIYSSKFVMTITIMHD